VNDADIEQAPLPSYWMASTLTCVTRRLTISVTCTGLVCSEIEMVDVAI